MNKLFKGIFIFGIIAILFFLPNKLAHAAGVKKPMVVDVVNKDEDTARPLIVGLNESGTDVKVYLNDSFVGQAHVNEGEGETSNFYFQPHYNLSQGENKFKFVAVNKESGQVSEYSEELVFKVGDLSAPTIISPNEETITAKVKPIITGLTKSGTRVLVYVDGVYNGKTEILTHESGVANFAYKPFLNLAPGKHSIWMVAKDATGRKSKISNIQYFDIELPLPPVTLLRVVKNDFNERQPFVVGLAKNDLYVKIYVDHKLDGKFKVKNNESGTANFYYKVKTPLNYGKHLVYAVTEDERGKESVWSNFVTTNIVRKIEPSISDTAVNDTGEEQDKKRMVESKLDDSVGSGEVNGNNNVAPSEVVDEQQTDKNTMDNKADKETDNKEVKDDVLEDIINQEISTSSNKSESGLVNEDNDPQGKSWSVFIFTLFLLAIIAWIFWVNKELIREKSKDEKDDKSGNE